MKKLLPLPQLPNKPIDIGVLVDRDATNALSVSISVSRPRRSIPLGASLSAPTIGVPASAVPGSRSCLTVAVVTGRAYQLVPSGFARASIPTTAPSTTTGAPLDPAGLLEPVDADKARCSIPSTTSRPRTVPASAIPSGALGRIRNDVHGSSISGPRSATRRLEYGSGDGALRRARSAAGSVATTVTGYGSLLRKRTVSVDSGLRLWSTW